MDRQTDVCYYVGGSMEIQEWRRLAVQSVVLFAVVLVSCLGFSRGLQNQLEPDVRAEEQRKNPGSKAAQQELQKEAPTVATRALVEERSNTYIKISKENILSPEKVYLQNKYMDFQVVLTFQGITSGCVNARDILRVQRYHVTNGKVSKSDAVLEKLQIHDRHRPEKKENRIQVKFTMKKAYEPILFEAEDAYYISLLTAREAHEKIVVIDAGHGGMDEGTSSSNKKHREKDYVLYIQEKLAALLEKTNVKVYYTRTRDENVAKKDRIRLANALQADLFVSIHCNALEGGTGTCGVETLYSKRKPKYGVLSNKKLAKLMLEQVTHSTGRKKRDTIVREGLYLLHHSRVPATIVEVGYMTNQGDMNYMKKEIGQQKIAEGIYQGILKALDESNSIRER